MLAGTAWVDFTPATPVPLGGQMHVRLGQYCRDPLTVNAAAFQDGPERVVLVSCDLCLLPDEFVRRVQQAAARACDLPPERLLVACTHTHVAPVTVDWLPGHVEPACMERLCEAIVTAARLALADLQEVQLFAGRGYLDAMGWNRRGLRRDGTAEMYWGSWKEGFAGIEGPRDGGLPLIVARTPTGRPLLVLLSFATHPNCVEGGEFYSADLPGEVRRLLRAALGSHLGVVYLTGAAGDTAPSIMECNPDCRQPWRGEAGLERSGQYLVGEALKVIAAAVDPMPDPRLVVERRVLSIPVRPWPDDFDPETLPAGGFRDFFSRSRAAWPELLRRESPAAVPVNVARLGSAAVCTNPGELYCAFGLQIKEASPAAVTLVAELADGYSGYIPTPDAVQRGGYSAYPGRQCLLVPQAGEQIVAATRRLLARAFGHARPPA